MDLMGEGQCWVVRSGRRPSMPGGVRGQLCLKGADTGFLSSWDLVLLSGL